MQKLPSHDTTVRVIWLLVHARLDGLDATRDLKRSVRMAAPATGQCVVTSVVGNFLIGRRGSRWLAVSVGARRLESGDRSTDCLCPKQALGLTRNFGEKEEVRRLSTPGTASCERAFAFGSP